MQQAYDDHFHFRDDNGNQALCRLQVYRNPNGAPEQALVLATELAANPGQSITNTYETLATFVTAVFGLRADHTLWVEHYNTDSYTGKPMEHEQGDRYCLVQMHWDGERFSTPRFAPLRESQLLGLVDSEEQQPQPFDGTPIALASVWAHSRQ